MHSAWYFLSGAILFEVAGTTCMKLSRGFSEITPSIMMFVFYACAFALNRSEERRVGKECVP